MDPSHDPAGRIVDRYCPDLTPQERDEARERLHGLAKALIRIAKREAEYDERLKTEPGGFALTPGFTCLYCLERATWYSTWKLTCAYCFEAFQTGLYPAFVATHPGSYVRRKDVEMDLGLTPKQMEKLINRSDLVPRGAIFLRKENPALTRSRGIIGYQSIRPA